MYTECPSCQTYFKITPNQLKAAGGKVRCGNCDNVFSALDSLVDVVPDEVLSQLTSSAVTEYSTAQEEALSLALSESQITKDTLSHDPSSDAGNFTELLNTDIAEKNSNTEEIPDVDAPVISALGELTADDEKLSLALETKIDDAVDSKTVQKMEINNEIDAALDGLFDGNTEGLIQDTAPVSQSISAPSELSSISGMNDLDGLGLGGTEKENEEKQGNTSKDDEVLSGLSSISDAETTSLSEFERELSASKGKNTLLDDSNFDLGDSFLDTDVDKSGSDEIKSAAILDDSDSVVDDSYVLEELEESSGRSTGAIAKVIWVFVIIILLMIILGQFAYVKRQKLATYPELKPVIEKFCLNLNKIYPCEIAAAKDVSAIELLERNVISHPNAKNALLITSTIENKAKFDQPFPNLILTFSDINQKIIAKRKFTPKEYLSEEVDIQAGMRKQVPIKIMLEIVDPGEEAVNFEFNFQ